MFGPNVYTLAFLRIYSYVPEISCKFQIKHRFERLEGHPGEVIVKAADKFNARYIICGSRGHGGLRRTILGSVSEYILHHSHVPVLICKHEDEKHRYDHHKQKDHKH